MQDQTQSSPPLSPTVIDLELNVEKTKSYIAEIQEPLADLTVAIDALQNQTVQIALSGELGTKQEILKLRQQVHAQDQKHKNSLSEIQGILDELLEEQIIENMRRQVEQEIAREIDELVQEQVAQCLKEHVPQDLQDEVASSKKKLEDLNYQLHNSESRRSNGNLRHNKTGDPLATMFMTNGSVSTRYPRDLKGLFELDGDTVKALMKDYGLPGPTESRDHNLNRFIQFCGVRYQLVEQHYFHFLPPHN